jgi:hypothetical protein
MKCTVCKKELDDKFIKIPNGRVGLRRRNYVCCVPCFVELFEIADMIDEANSRVTGLSVRTTLALCLWSSR